MNDFSTICFFLEISFNTRYADLVMVVSAPSLPVWKGDGPKKKERRKKIYLDSI